VLVTVSLIETNLRRNIAETLPEQTPALFLLDIPQARQAALIETLSGLEGVGAIDSAPYLRGRIIAMNGQEPRRLLEDSEQGWIINGDLNISVADAVPEGDRLSAGSWWDGTGGSTPRVSIEDEAARGFGLTPGDTLTVNILGRRIEAEIANLRDIAWSAERLNFPLLFNPGALSDAPFSYVASLQASRAAESVVLDRLAADFPQVTAVRVRDALAEIEELVGQIATAVRVTASVALVAAVLVLAGAIAAGQRRRIYEAVVLKVVGAPPGRVLRVYLVEFAGLGLLAGAGAVALGTLAAWLVTTRVFEGDWFLAWLPVLGGLALALIAVIALGLAGSWRALKAKPAPLLRNE
jgi:putative ABC transport system permease protein